MLKHFTKVIVFLVVFEHMWIERYDISHIQPFSKARIGTLYEITSIFILFTREILVPFKGSE